MYLRHLLHLNLSRPDTLTSPQKHIKLCVDLTGCPSLCAALIYPNSGFPENPQISVKHNQPSTLHQAAGAYSVQLHKSHCNLCRVITGFRCLPLNEPSNLKYLMWQENQEFFSVFITSHPGFSFVSQRSLFRVASFGNISTCSSFEMFVSLAENVLHNGAFCPRYLIQACYGRKERATHITTELLTFTSLSTVIHRFPSQNCRAPL